MRGIVTIVGRPNVGKSTLFNRLVEERKAIIYDQPGVTRDRNWGICEWNGLKFTVVDTGGLVTESADVFEAAVQEQIEIAVTETDVILFLIDVFDGVTSLDEEVAHFIRTRNQNAKVLLVVNKVDSAVHEKLVYEAYLLGFENLFAISGMSGSGTGDLLDEVTRLLSEAEFPEPQLEDIPKIALVGKPNVGKSSLINALLGVNQHIVTPIPGTTRDTVYTRYTAFGFDYYLVDTAGLRKRAKVTDNIEYYSTIRTARAVTEADVAVVMVDGTETLDAQDLSVIALVEKNRKGIIIAVNKWDVAPDKSPEFEKEYRAYIEARLAPLIDVPILFISALEKLRIHKLMQTVGDVYKERKKHISTRALNDAIIPIIEKTPPASQRGKLIRIKFVTQVEAQTPTFIFFANHPKLVGETYRRFLEKQIRALFGFKGCCINIFFKEK